VLLRLVLCASELTYFGNDNRLIRKIQEKGSYDSDQLTSVDAQEEVELHVTHMRKRKHIATLHILPSFSRQIRYFAKTAWNLGYE
jgi:hypothetical protein